MATELGKAYIQIMPSAKGIGKNIEDTMNNESGGAGEKAGKKLGGSLVATLGKVLVAAGIGKLITSAINAGGELEQNLGGTEAVFGEFAKSIQNSAKDAYKNMGLSASDYMATANKMGSLFQGSGVKQERALELTSAAMQRAADVASVMGLDTTMAMESIAGAAKGNFTMMDNLGVAMNATTLQAYALEKGINFDWKTADNAEKAELAMQMFMERTTQYAGNFARESTETFSGSLGAMKSAFTDTLAALSTGEGLPAALGNLSGTIVNFAKNLIPMVSNVVKELPGIFVTILSETGPQLVEVGINAIMDIATGLGESMEKLVPVALEAVLTILDTILDNIPLLLESGMDIIIGLAFGLMDAIPILLEKVPEIINKLIIALTDRIPYLTQTGVDLLTSLIDELPTILETLAAAMPQLIETLISALLDMIPYLVLTGIDLLESLIEALPKVLTTISAAMPDIINSIVNALIDNIDFIIEAGEFLLTALVDNLPSIITTITEVIPSIVDNISRVLIDNIDIIIETGVKLLVALVKALPQIITAIANVLPRIVESITRTLINNIGLIINAGVTLITALVKNLPAIISAVVQAVPQIIKSLVSAFMGSLGAMKDVGKNLLLGLSDGISGAVGSVVKKAKEAAKKVLDSVKNFFGIKSPSRVFMQIGAYLDEGLADGISDNVKPVTKAMEKVGELTTKSYESELAFNATASTSSSVAGLRASVNSGLRSAQQDNQRRLEELLARSAGILDKYLPQLANMQLVMDTGVTVGALAGPMDKELGKIAIGRSRGR